MTAQILPTCKNIGSKEGETASEPETYLTCPIHTANAQPLPFQNHIFGCPDDACHTCQLDEVTLQETLARGCDVECSRNICASTNRGRSSRPIRLWEGDMLTCKTRGCDRISSASDTDNMPEGLSLASATGRQRRQNRSTGDIWTGFQFNSQGERRRSSGLDVTTFNSALHTY